MVIMVLVTIVQIDDSDHDDGAHRLHGRWASC
jgi:hypothetical protein